MEFAKLPNQKPYMKKLLLLILLSNISLFAFAQEIDLEQTAASIKAEADVLYRSEFASWHGTDIFKEKCASKLKQVGGYLSYDNGAGLTNIFYSAEAKPKVLATILFTYDFNPTNYKLDTTERYLNNTENSLYEIRKEALA